MLSPIRLGQISCSVVSDSLRPHESQHTSLELASCYYIGLPYGGSAVKKRICLPMQEMQVRSLGREDPLAEEMATHSSILAWRISWTEEPGRLQFMGSQTVKHD